jgi:hypothetical protein
MNLIRNGAEAMENADSPDKRLDVRSQCTDECIIVEVCDYGPGVTHPENVFEPFYSTKQNGLGVGLAISRSIVQAHGGAVQVRDNQRGGGAAAAFALLHGASNGILTIARGMLPLAIFGPENYAYRLGLIGAPSRICQALAPVTFGPLDRTDGTGCGGGFSWYEPRLSLRLDVVAANENGGSHRARGRIERA